MIDTDKYEGHTPGQWKHFYSPWGGARDIVSERHGIVGRWEHQTDGLLMADAPLLLEEVKRLRKVEKTLMGLVTPYLSTAEIEKALEMIE